MQLSRSSADVYSGAPGLLGRLLTFALGAALLVAAVTVSLLVLAVALTGGLLVGGFVWWKTRELRKPMCERAGGCVIKGGEDSGRRVQQ